MRPAVLAIFALFSLIIAGCSNEAATSAAPAVTTQTAAPTTTIDPLAGYSNEERGFIAAFKSKFSTTGPRPEANIMQIGEYICSDIRLGLRPTQTQTALAKNVPSPQDAATLYTLAHDVLCPEVPLPNPNSFSDGTYEVGVDIQPGRYRSPGGDSCYWARLAKDQMEILDNNLTSGPSVIIVKETDGFVELSRCTWTLSP